MRHFLATFGIALLTACASQPESKPPASAPPPIRITDGVLVNSDGMTLYTFDRDVAGSGTSNCNGECAFIWPPLQVANAKPSGDFSVITREGGERQWAYKGKPLYLFSDLSCA
jgi:predicted lipoprotein with Yx(FWY)xxD motif